MQRANHALEKGPDVLAHAVRSALDALVSEAAHDAGLSPDDICAAVVVGNTCMHHLLLGLSPASLVRAPYRPALAEPLTLAARDYIHIHQCGKLLVLPNIAGFVGSDTVGVMLATDFDRTDELMLAIDIGTNGELVLGDRRRVMTCSTAAGPAFEGAKIACGMRGTTGAIDHVVPRIPQAILGIEGRTCWRWSTSSRDEASPSTNSPYVRCDGDFWSGFRLSYRSPSQASRPPCPSRREARDVGKRRELSALVDTDHMARPPCQRLHQRRPVRRTDERCRESPAADACGAGVAHYRRSIDIDRGTSPPHSAPPR